MNLKYRLLIIVALIFSSILGHSQPDCRTIIGAHLTPIGQSPISWAVEGTLAGGLLSDREIANWSGYGAIDFTKNSHTIYFEGAYKNWYNSAANPDGEAPQTDLPDLNRPTRYNWGFREMYYQFDAGQTFFKIGIQGMKTNDYFLFDERFMGATFKKQKNAILIAGHLGTVSQRIARFQDVCGTRHIYNLFHRSQFNFVSDRPFESNFGALFLTYQPNKRKQEINVETNDVNSDEFEVFESTTDEFSSFESDGFDAFNAPEKKNFKFNIQEIGVLFYEEFGTQFHEYKYYSGIYTAVDLMAKISLKAELIDQYIVNDHCVAYFISLQKNVAWQNGSNTEFAANYLEKIDVVQGAHFYPSFSNLFMGEIMRLDAIDLPLANASIKHKFSGKQSASIQLNNIFQLNNQQTREYDLIAGMKLLHHIRLTSIFSYVTSNLLDEDYLMGRLELRVAF